MLAIFAVADIVYQPTGYGVAADLLVEITVITTIVSITVLVTVLAIATIRRLPPLLTGVVVGAAVVMAFAGFPQPSLRVGVLALSLCFAGALIGGLVATLASRRLPTTIVGRTVTNVLLAAATAYSIGVMWIGASEGDATNLSRWQPHQDVMPAMVAANNPREAVGR